MTNDVLRFLDLFDMTDIERDVYLYVARYQTAVPQEIAVATGHSQADVQQALASLREQGRLTIDAAGAGVHFGRTGGPRTTLPLQLDAALTVSERLYSKQEIETLQIDQPPAAVTMDGLALLVFPCAPHSLVMAARNGQQLEKAGYIVECLCYPDLPGAATWLWRDTLPDFAADTYDCLILIGDRPERSVAGQRLALLGQRRAAGVAITMLNRHEATWSDLPALIDLGIDVVLGNDWSYFWQDQLTTADVAWGRVAATCTREVVMAAGLNEEDEIIAAGLLATFFDASARGASDAAGWLALAEPIMELIAADDWDYFRDHADRFRQEYAKAVYTARREGRVIVFDAAPGALPSSSYWAMEQAILQTGRKMERGIHFNAPYAVAT